MKKHIITLICVCLTVCFTAYLMLDTFIISRIMEDGAYDVSGSFAGALEKLSGGSDTSSATGTRDTAAPDTAPGDVSGAAASEQGSTSQAAGTAVPAVGASAVSQYLTGARYESYSDGNISIDVKEYRYLDTELYVADVTVSSAEYLKTAFAKSSYGRNITAKTSVIAAENGAILAINGDYYGVQERGYVIRNGKVYRSTSGSVTELACIYADGSMGIVSTSDYTAAQLVGGGVWQAFSFGPALIADGLIAVDSDDEVGRAMASNPRTAIGMISPCHYVFVVSDGRTAGSAGLTLRELAEFMQGLGAAVAYNLDGGGSSTMYYMGQVINRPTSGGRISERSVSDIVYVG